MKPLWKNFWKALWNDENYARGLIRGGLHSLGLGGMGLATQLSRVWPTVPAWLVASLAVGSLVVGFFSGNIVAGQTNPRREGAPE
jgi:hypothetical protein